MNNESLGAHFHRLYRSRHTLVHILTVILISHCYRVCRHHTCVLYVIERKDEKLRVIGEECGVNPGFLIKHTNKTHSR